MIPPCGQCGKPGVRVYEEVPVCVDCWHKVEICRTLSFRLSAIGMNFAADQMDELTGLGRQGARMEVPSVPAGPVILHHIKVDNSVIGAINTGTVHSIDVNLTHLETAGNDSLQKALASLTQAIINEANVPEAERKELLEQVAFISDQSVVAAEQRKPGLIKPILADITLAAKTVGAIGAAWNIAVPIIKAHFGF